MGEPKSNEGITFEKDDLKSYVYIKDNGKDVGMLLWHYKKKKWIYEEVK